MSELKVQNLRREFGDVVALEDMSFDVADGEFFCLLGPSSSAPHRIQGCWVEEEEVRAIVKHWKDQAPEFTDDQSVATDGDGDATAMLDTGAASPPAAPAANPGGVSDTPPSVLRCITSLWPCTATASWKSQARSTIGP